jgi:hypothetical protein
VEPTRYTIPDDVLSAHLEGEAVLLNVETKHYYRLNDTAAHVFEGLERGLDRDALLADLRATFDVAPDVAAAELDRLLGELVERGLVVAGGGEEAAP